MMDYKGFADDVSKDVLEAMEQREKRKSAAIKAAEPMLRELKELVRALGTALPAAKHLGKVSGRSHVSSDSIVHYDIHVINSDGVELELRAEFDNRQNPPMTMSSPSGEEFEYDDREKLIEMASEDIRRFLTTL